MSQSLYIHDNPREPSHGLAASSQGADKGFSFSPIRFLLSSDDSSSSPGQSSGLPFSPGSNVAPSDLHFGSPTNLQSSPDRSSVHGATQDPHPSSISSSLPCGSPSSPYHKNVHPSYPPRHIDAQFPHSYRPPTISICNDQSRVVHANLPTTVQRSQTSQFTEAASEGPFEPQQSVIVPYAYGGTAPQFSQPFIPGGYASAHPFRPANFPPYPSPQGCFSSSLVYSSYPALPHYQLQCPEADRQTSWPSPSHSRLPPEQSEVYAELYPICTKENVHSTSAPSRPENLVDMQEAQRLPMLEIGLDTGPGRAGKGSLERRPYHPNPPAYRLQWVMWVGNVPADATHDELWRFFTESSEDTPDDFPQRGVLSIFLISRTSCAFVNYQSEAYLDAAMKHFNGHPLRRGDPRCPKLVCRIRRADDDLKAGVGGQRGMGMHIRWIKEQRAKASDQGNSSLESSLNVLPKISISGSDDLKMSTSSSDSTRSTTSSLLAVFFPQRYFILKSLSRFDLDVSKEEGAWATQKHNEGILNQAFRTSKDVYLIFSVNKSGEFYGYAKMTGSSMSNLLKDEKKLGLNVITQGNENSRFFSPSPNHLVDESPLPMSVDAPILGTGLTSFLPAIDHTVSAPAELGTIHEQMSMVPQLARRSIDYRLLFPSVSHVSERFELDPLAPARAIRSKVENSQVSTVEVVKPGNGSKLKGRHDNIGGRAEDGKQSGGWGGSFKIQWLSTEKVSFQKTKNIRNPWNHDREVKVSRDGTELEPSVGRKLIEQWAVLAKKS